MLKINLMPSRRDTGGGAPDNVVLFLGALIGALVLLVVGLGIFHHLKSEEIAQKHAETSALEARTRATRARVADSAHVRDELAQLRAREEAIARLEGARTGPTSMLVELSHLLSPGGRPASDPAVLDRMRREGGGESFNPTWDPHRLWVSKFAEDRRNVLIEGAGRTADDVGEFMRRMMVSQYFTNVQLERSQGGIDPTTRVGVQQFKITARVRY